MGDQDNLLLMRKDTREWEPIEGEYGGVDGCLYSPLSGGSIGTPEPDHNRNIPDHFPLPAKWCHILCARTMKGTSLCSSHQSCVVDLTVLMSLEAVHKAGGPRIPMS